MTKETKAALGVARRAFALFQSEDVDLFAAFGKEDAAESYERGA